MGADNQGKGSIPDATAKKLLDEALAIEEAEVARYIQMENKIRALVRFDLAANVPLVQ